MVNRDKRFTTEAREDYRTPAQVDRDRILYSRHFQRLAEVTQVVSADRGYVFHNRLTHSLKVAQLARRLAEKLGKEQKGYAAALGGLDPDATEAAALAHDLGHPPFGHIAEDELNKLTRKAGLRDGFNGNAQSFRIVTNLAVGNAVAKRTREPIPRGLNLTRGTLNGILKYPWGRGENQQQFDKWGFYSTERAVFNWVRKGYAKGSLMRSVEAEIMDWADDITYAVHDLVDFYCADQIPLDRIADQKDSSERERFLTDVFSRRRTKRKIRPRLDSAFRGIIELFAAINRRYDGALSQQRDLWQLVTILISRYVNRIRLSGLTQSPSVVVCEERARDEIFMLKESTWHYVILKHELAAQQCGQREAVRTVWMMLLKGARKTSGWTLFPLEYREQLDHARWSVNLLTRIVTDFVASMSEPEIMRMYRSLRGR